MLARISATADTRGALLTGRCAQLHTRFLPPSGGLTFLWFHPQRVPTSPGVKGSCVPSTLRHSWAVALAISALGVGFTGGSAGVRAWRRIARALHARIGGRARARPEFHERCLRPWTPERQRFEALLADLRHPRVRDLAWAALNPVLCHDGDGRHGHRVLTSARMRLLLGDVAEKLRSLDRDPRPLERWLSSHRHSGSGLVGLYYELLLHFAFVELAGLEVVLYSEPIPKEASAAATKPLDSPSPVTKNFKPALKSSRGVEYFCRIHRFTRDADCVTIEYTASRGRCEPPVPTASKATLEFNGEVRTPCRCVPDASNQPSFEGHVVFEKVPANARLFFTYAPGFSKVSLEALEKPAPALLGEVDYVLWPDLSSPRFVHVEAAVKFYMAVREGAREWDDFIAPNPIDTLDLKLNRMLSHQLGMGQTPHIRNILSARVATSDDGALHFHASATRGGVGAGRPRPPVEVEDALWMNGRLFHHASFPLDRPGKGPEPWHERIPMLSPDLEVGWWCYFAELASVLPEGFHFVVVQKPHWLAHLRGEGAVHTDHGKVWGRNEFLAMARTWKQRHLVAVVMYLHGSSDFEEVCRGFVVPNDWPHGKRNRR